MAQTTGLNLPVDQSPFTDPKTGQLTYDGKNYLLSILQEAANGQATSTVSTGLVAAGTNQATALQLTSQWNEVDTVASGAGVLLSAYQAGQSQTVFNQGLNPLLVYPAPGAQIDALGVNVAFSLASGSRITFDFVSSTQIRS